MSNLDGYSYRRAVGLRFAARMQQGDAVFQTGNVGLVNLPCTINNGEIKPFSGSNLFVLLQVLKDRGLNDPRFFIDSQINEAGWSVLPDAKRVTLQFMFVNDVNGEALEKPVVKQFSVVHAADIEGVPEININQDFGADDLQVVLDKHGCDIEQLLIDVQGDSLDRIPEQDALSRTLAIHLLSVMSAGELPITLIELPVRWIEEIQREPIFIIEAMRDAEKLAAEISSRVKNSIFEKSAEKVISENRNVVSIDAEKNSGGEMGHRRGVSARIEEMFAERNAVLAVPFADIAAAKKLGAVFHSGHKLWFVPKDIDVGLFTQWNPKRYAMGAVATRDSLLASFAEAMTDLGLDVTAEIIDDGRWHNVPVLSTSKNNKAGSYIVSLNGSRSGGALGTIINKHTGESFTWTHAGASLTVEERTKIRADLLIKDEQLAKQTLQLQDVVAGHAVELWNSAVDATGHGYAVKKGIGTQGLRQINGAELKKYSEFVSENGGSIIRSLQQYLLVPLYNSTGDLRSLQVINEDGSVKSFMRGGQKKGTMMVLGASSVSELASIAEVREVAYVEGMATGMSLYEATCVPVIVCFDAGNLETVVKNTVSLLSSEVKRILAVDNDQYYVEKALHHLAEKLGLNPFQPDGEIVLVSSGNKESCRPVCLGEIVADGEWHQVPKGSYCVSLIKNADAIAVQSVVVDVLQVNQRKERVTFLNRGVDAGIEALSALKEKGVSSVMLKPEFTSLDGRPSDWNDLAQKDGLDSIRGVFLGHGCLLSGIGDRIIEERVSHVAALSR